MRNNVYWTLTLLPREKVVILTLDTDFRTLSNPNTWESIRTLSSCLTQQHKPYLALILAHRAIQMHENSPEHGIHGSQQYTLKLMHPSQKPVNPNGSHQNRTITASENAVTTGNKTITVSKKLQPPPKKSLITSKRRDLIPCWNRKIPLY